MSAKWWDVWKKRSMQSSRSIKGEAHAAAVVLAADRQPNELDRRRILRSLASRQRYRYVSPTVEAITDGYVIRSPCCSRRVDPEGGVVDVAWLEHHVGQTRSWNLYRKSHLSGQWLLHGSYARLPEALEVLNADPQRLFWQ